MTTNFVTGQSPTSHPGASAGDNKGDLGQFKAPHISLPKGGGAVRGIGEKFAANPVIGTGSMSVPIATSPGRSGFGPELSISYDSGAGNGPFGFGWSLSLPQITRKTDKGLPQYKDEEESDVFLLSGSDDLVPLLNQVGGRHEDFTTYPGYTIHRYRPRIEGLFARIERWTSSEGDVHWRSISRDNILTLYGKDHNSRIADPADPQRIFTWLICETRDDKGNAVVYEYKQDDGTGVDLTKAHERNRGERNSLSRTANRYLKYIRYGNRASLLNNEGGRPRFITPAQIQGAGWMFEVIFDYDEGHLFNVTTNGDQKETVEASTVPGKEWAFRDDPFSSFRAGFEVRTVRLCKRVLMIHHFSDEEGVGNDCLVRSTDFTFSHEQAPENARNPVYTFLQTVTQSGYKRDNGSYLKKSLPPVDFEYTMPVVQDTVEEVDSVSLENLPIGLDEVSYQWTDLHGEGIPGILTEQTDAWFYKRNISPVSTRSVEFAPLEQVLVKPNLTQANGAQFMDLAGDGLPDLVMLDGPMPGLFEHDDEEGWQSFRPFTSRLNRNFRDPNLKFVDLNGDGHADVLITEDDAFVWHPSLEEEGFGPSRRVNQEFDEEKGPRLVFADGTQSIYLADLSGDGLTDLTRIRNGEVCYWPNLGYGRFGKKVTMDNGPQFDHPDQFDQKHIRLADIDGTGTTDIIYLHRDGVRLYFNQSGNSWSEPQRLNVFPRTDDLVSIVPVDLLGNGTACLVWSSPLPGDTGRQMRYVNLMGGQKPHLLVKTVNNLGAETRVEYAPSTKFYLQDKRDGKPWYTRLPFPVHVVERVETYDHISRNRFVTRYAYHHGYYDGEEREFRGFAMVEQYDSEAFEDYVLGVQQVDGNQEIAPELYQPPVTTRTWYHTGAWIDQGQKMHQFWQEYYQQQQYIPEPVLPEGLDAQELRECLRALKGLPLRQEVYSFDSSQDQAHPFTVTENNFEVRQLQPRGQQLNGVYFPTGRESVSFNYERNTADPRVAHSLALELDEYGNTLKSCSVVYGRRTADPSLPAEVTQDQQKYYITYSETNFTTDIDQVDRGYRLRVPYEWTSYEITGIKPAAALFKLEEIKPQITNTDDIAYEVVAEGLTPQKRLLSHRCTVFRDNALLPLPLGQWDALGLQYQSYQLAFTPGVAGKHYGSKVSEADFTAAGYLHLSGDSNWWIPSGIAVYPPNPSVHFYLPVGFRDPLGVETTATLDPYHLLLIQVQVLQASWNVTSIVNDYRVLGPVVITDPNKNRSAVEMDALGMIVKTAIMGKEGAADGDTLDDPTVRMEYELFNWMTNQSPNFVHTYVREEHGAANSRWQESYTYSNGSGEVALVKAQAHPGQAFQVNEEGIKVVVHADPRWVGNGRTILNNKGKAVKQYEPYFSTSHAYEDEQIMREIGVTPIFYYDAVGRNTSQLFPNGTFAKVDFDPWGQQVHDANDTIKQSQWYADRGSPDPATQPEPLDDPERRTAWLAAKHADTPSRFHFNSLGRPVLAVSDYGAGKTAAVRSETDLTGRFSRLFDQAHREVASGFVGMAGTRITGETAEKGRRWAFQNVLGALVKTWDEHGREFRYGYDHLHRPLSTFIQESGQAEILFSYVVYGDRLSQAEQWNLLGTAHLIFDQGGMVRVPEFDFKGNPKLVERLLAKDYKNSIDWTALATQPDYDALQVVANSKLETEETFSASATYNASNRPIRVTLPEGTVILPTYNEANLLASLQVQPRGKGVFIEFLKKQDYDAKGQRQFALYGNEVFTSYFYDPKTFRLTNLLTYKSGTDPQTQGLQNLHYTYDPAGNITQIRDDAQQTHFFNNEVIKPESFFEYDATYQLIRASGREHAGLTNSTIRSHSDLEFEPQLPHANNADVVRRYIEEFEYDLLGNIKVLRHRFKAQHGVGNGWTSRYRYAYEDDPANRTNRLKSTNLPEDPDPGPYTADYDHDAYGNMTRMPHLTRLDWNFLDQLRQVDLGGGGTAHYVYGIDGQRLRKVIERNGNLKLEWIFLGAVMIFRRRRSNTNELRLERCTVQISDNTGRIAQIDTKTQDLDNSDPANALNTPLIRYQYANHIGSATLETDDTGTPISYEEYHVFGSSAYRSAKHGFDLSLKRYRFSDKERDEESGLYYFGARYYAPWLGRWTSADPAGFISGTNLYCYCSNNPVVFIDPNGMDDTPVVAPPPIAYSGTRQQFLSYINNTELTGTYQERPVAFRVSVTDVRRVSDSEGRRFWQATAYTFVPGSARYLDETATEGDGETGGGTSPDASVAPADSSATGGDSPDSQPSPDAAPNGSTDVPGSGGQSQETAPGSPASEGVDLNDLPNPNAGASAVTTWDSIHRGRYTAGNAARSAEAVSQVRAATHADDAVRAWETAREASDARSAARTATQGRLSPGGRAMSQAIDAGRNFQTSVAEYSARAPGARTPSPHRYAYTIAERVAEGSGRSHPWMSRLARGGRVLGPLGIAIGLGFAGSNIYNADSADRGRVTAGEVGNFAGGMIGVSLGMSAGVALAGGVSGLLIGLGIAAGPIGWLAIGLGILGGIAGAWAFGNLGRSIGEGLYDW
jgi:RHS repeat-associated protein